MLMYVEYCFEFCKITDCTKGLSCWKIMNLIINTYQKKKKNLIINDNSNTSPHVWAQTPP